MKKRQVSAVMKGLEADVTEIGYGMSAGVLKASRPSWTRAFSR
jgi:hypothetical protein